MKQTKAAKRWLWARRLALCIGKGAVTGLLTWRNDGFLSAVKEAA